jgi:hypothetical protein
LNYYYYYYYYYYYESTVLLLGLGRIFSFLILYTVGRTPWNVDQPVARPLPTHRTIQTQNKRTQTSIPSVWFEPTNSSVRTSKERPLWPAHGKHYLVIHYVTLYQHHPYKTHVLLVFHVISYTQLLWWAQVFPNSWFKDHQWSEKKHFVRLHCKCRDSLLNAQIYAWFWSKKKCCFHFKKV